MYKLKYVIIGTIVIALLGTSQLAVAGQQEETQVYVKEKREIESGFYHDDGYPRDTKNRPTINPDFAPDRSCDLVWELKCIPGSEQQCRDLRGYDNGEMDVCTPIGCPDGYHDIFEWEDNVCYSNEIDCPNDWILAKDAYGKTCEPEAS